MYDERAYSAKMPSEGHAATEAESARAEMGAVLAEMTSLAIELRDRADRFLRPSSPPASEPERLAAIAMPPSPMVEEIHGWRSRAEGICVILRDVISRLDV